MADLKIDITNGQSQEVTFTTPTKQRVASVIQPEKSVAIVDKYSIAGLAGSKDKNFIHQFSNLAWTQDGDEWYLILNHTLNKNPAIQMFDSMGTLVYPDVKYIDDNTLEFRTKGVFSGKIVLN